MPDRDGGGLEYFVCIASARGGLTKVSADTLKKAEVFFNRKNVENERKKTLFKPRKK